MTESEFNGGYQKFLMERMEKKETAFDIHDNDQFIELVEWAWRKGYRPMMGQMICSATTTNMINKEVKIVNPMSNISMRIALAKAIALAAGFGEETKE